MTGMSLSTAESAGALAREILTVTAAVTALNDAAINGDAIVVSLVVSRGGNRQDLMTGLSLSQPDSATILNGVWQSYQTLLNQYNAALAALVVT